MANEIRKKLASLMSVRSFVTLFTTLVFCYLAIAGAIPGNDFMTVFMVIITFYFAKDTKKETAVDTTNKEG